MQYQHIGFRIKGFYRIAKYAARHLAMGSNKAEYKLKILQFWEKHGLAATLDAFPVKRRTLFLWKKAYKAGNCLPAALAEKSKRPHRIRQRKWPQAIMDEIRRLKREHPNLGKEKLYVLLEQFCQKVNLRCPKARTIGRIIADAKDKMRFAPVRLDSKGRTKLNKKSTMLRKPKGFKANYPGHCVAFDTVERFIDGTRRYILTFTDIYSRFCFAWATTSHSSRAAAHFFFVVSQIFPYPIKRVLTDGGSEFKKDFDAALKAQDKTHWRTYPKSPKMNAHNERFNRTIQEEFVEYHLSELLELDGFNEKLMEYLLWYNGSRPHWALGLQSPIQFLIHHNHQCNMWWPNTLIWV